MRLLTLIVLLFLAVSCVAKPDGATSESDVLDVLSPINESDIAPTTGDGGSVSITFMGVDSLEARFTLATDDYTASSSLQYKVVHSSSLETLSESSTSLFSWQTFNSGVLTVTNLTADPYYFLLMVRDEKFQNTHYQVFSNAPSLPADPSIAGNATGANSIDLSWSLSSHSFLNPSVLQYQVYISTSDNISTLSDAKANGVLIKGWSANLSSFTATGLDALTPYFFNVVVKTPFGVEQVYQSGAAISTL